MRSKFEQHPTFWTLAAGIIGAIIGGVFLYFGSDLAAIRYSVEVTQTAEAAQTRAAETSRYASTDFLHYDDPSKVISIDYPAELEGGLNRTISDASIVYQVGMPRPANPNSWTKPLVLNIIDYYRSLQSAESAFYVSVSQSEVEWQEDGWKRFIDDTMTQIEEGIVQGEGAASIISTEWRDDQTYLIESKVLQSSDEAYMFFLFQRGHGHTIFAYAVHYGARSEPLHSKLRQSLEGIVVDPTAFQATIAAYDETVNQAPRVIVQSESRTEINSSFEDNNCGGVEDLVRVVSGSQSISVAVSPEAASSLGTSVEWLEAEARAAVDAALTQSSAASPELRALTPPGFNRSFQISLIGTRRTGIIENLRPGAAAIPFSVIEITDLYITGQQDLGCPAPLESDTSGYPTSTQASLCCVTLLSNLPTSTILLLVALKPISMWQAS